MSENWCKQWGFIFSDLTREPDTGSSRQVYWLSDRLAGLGVHLHEDRGHSEHK